MRFERVAFVQSKQSYLVPEGDPFFNEDRVFYGAVQLAMDSHDTVIACGSAVLYRRAALDDIGGFATWNLVEESRDDSVTYSDPTEFRRRHAQWSLTGDGQATIAALTIANDRLAAAAALQPAAIDAIASALADVADWLDNEPGVRDGGSVDSDVAAQVHIRLFDAESHHQSLIANLRAFTRDVAAVVAQAPW